MLDSGGLLPVQMGAQVKITDGKLNVVDGPFVETKEMIGGYAIFELAQQGRGRGRGARVHAAALDHMPGWEGTCEVRIMATPGDEMACQVDAEPRQDRLLSRRFLHRRRR